MAIDWHYPRKELTERVISAFELGVSDTLTLFAPRRMGKTEFVRYDLIPAAAKRGYAPVYVSFWDNRDDPASALKLALETALAERNWWRRFSGTQFTVKASSTGQVEASVSVSAKQPVAPDTETLSDLRKCFVALIKNNDKILLCLDEAQHLASSAAFENLVFFLRTILDENRGKVRVMYTGSSRDGLRKLFSRRKAALFQSSSQIDLPALGSGFIDHMRSCFRQASGRDFSLMEGQRAFTLLGRVPREFRSVIERMALAGSEDIVKEAIQAYDEQIEDGCYPATWKGLKGIDQALLTWIAWGQANLYQDACKGYLADQLGIESLETHTVQNAINRLRGEHLSLVSHGNYEFEDTRFQEWIVRNTNAPHNVDTE